MSEQTNPEQSASGIAVMGTQVTAAFITPECRTSRSNDGAWDEAVSRLKAEYDAVIKGWERAPTQPTLNLILTIERPPAPGEG